MFGSKMIIGFVLQFFSENSKLEKRHLGAIFPYGVPGIVTQTHLWAQGFLTKAMHEPGLSQHVPATASAQDGARIQGCAVISYP